MTSRRRTKAPAPEQAGSIEEITTTYAVFAAGRPD
jgi:hypothetical protein